MTRATSSESCSIRNRRRRPWRGAEAIVAVGVLALLPSVARASCNAIPAIERSFPSALGAVSRPFAQPGEEIVVRREEAVFSADPADNRVALRFEAPGDGPATTVTEVEILAPSNSPDAGCRPADCTDDGCRCLRFLLPDTDDLVGVPGDGRTLAGPVSIEVLSRGSRTALITRLVFAGTTVADDVFATFVALPPANRFADLTSGGDVLAAADAGGNLLIPFDFAPIVPAGPDPQGINAPRSRFLEAVVSSLTVETPPAIDSFTPDGRRLPPLIRSLSGRSLVGTVDVRHSVLRVAGGRSLVGGTMEESNGPVVIRDVVGRADPRKRADSFLLKVGTRFAVYENRECSALGVSAGSEFDCIDTNQDGDRSDYFLQALDLTTPGADPVTIDEVDGADFAGYPSTFSPAFLYSFDATDDLVAFRIPEPSNQFGRPPVIDIDGDGITHEVIRSGIYDLANGRRVPEAEGSLRQEIDGGLAAFTTRPTPPTGSAVLYAYDVAQPGRGAFLVSDATHAEFPVTRTAAFGNSQPDSTVAGDLFSRSLPFDIATSGHRIGFVVPEKTLGEDLTGDGDADDQAVLVYDNATGGVVNPAQATEDQALQLSPRWLVYFAIHDEAGVLSLPVGLVDLERPYDPPRFLCDRPFGVAYFAQAMSDSLIACTADEGGNSPGSVPVDLNGDGDTVDDNVLHVFLPDAPGGPVEINLGLAVLGIAAPVISGDRLVVAVDETRQGRDLNGDGVVEVRPFPVGGPFTLHAFNGVSRKLINFGREVLPVGDPLVQFIDRGLIAYLPDVNAPAGSLFVPARTILRDTDGDGHFEELFRDPETGTVRLADNCPLVANPRQRPSDCSRRGAPIRGTMRHPRNLLPRLHPEVDLHAGVAR